MKFSLSLHLERSSPNVEMTEVTRNMLELVQLADRGGFETVWTSEHHTIEVTAAPNPFTVLTWLGQHTDRIRLGTATLVAPYWSPIRLAGEAALCDHLTNGRLELGIARGAYQYEFDRMAGGIPQQQGMEFMQELVPAVQMLWKGDYAHEGKHWRFPTATSVPKPLQQPHPRLWVAARDPGTFDWAVGIGASILSTPLAAPASEIAVLGQKFADACAAHPNVPKPRFMMLRRTCAYSNEADRVRAIESSMFYGRLFENLFQNIGTVKNGFPEAVSLDAVAGKDNYKAENIERNYLFGSVDQIIEKLMAYEQAGVDQLCLGLNFSLPYDLQKATVQLFSQEILPIFEERARARNLDAAQ
ncbi:LLM class flavin-dependent oxidoreductase [Rhizobium sp. A37_96]